MSREDAEAQGGGLACPRSCHSSVSLMPKPILPHSLSVRLGRSGMRGHSCRSGSRGLTAPGARTCVPGLGGDPGLSSICTGHCLGHCPVLSRPCCWSLRGTPGGPTATGRHESQACSSPRRGVDRVSCFLIILSKLHFSSWDCMWLVISRAQKVSFLLFLDPSMRRPAPPPFHPSVLLLLLPLCLAPLPTTHGGCCPLFC